MWKTVISEGDVIESPLVKGYYVVLPGSPIEHYFFIAINPAIRTSYICGCFDLILN